MFSVLRLTVRRAHFRQVLCMARTSLSTSAMETKPMVPTIVNISPVLRFHKFNQDNENAPITLLLPWATATERALDRFRQLYAERGFNVLTAYAKPVHFLWPEAARPAAAEIERHLRTATGSSPLVVHAFSIGAFMYANMLLALMEEDGEEDGEEGGGAAGAGLADLRPRLRGQVFDSIVIGSLLEMRMGTAKMLTPSRLLQRLVIGTSGLYFALTRRRTVALYDRLVAAFKANPFHTPILCFYSLRDPMCHTQSMEAFIEAWEGRARHPAHFRRFSDAGHAEILRAHPTEYREALFKYLDTLALDGGKDSLTAHL